MPEQLARGVSGWDARAAEFFQQSPPPST